MGKHVLSIFVCSLSLLVGCSQIDDYFLGKDNTPHPAALKPISQQVRFEPLWQVQLGGGVLAQDKLAPVIKQDTIYVALVNGQIQARDLKTGALRWARKLSHSMISGPVANEGVLAVGTRDLSLVVLNQGDGQVRWTKKLSGELLSPPVIYAHQIFAKTVDGNVYAFDLGDGKRQFQVQHGSPELILKASSSPVVLPEKDWLLTGFSDGKLSAIDYHNGQVVWEKPIAFSTGASEVERLVDIAADPIPYHNTILLATYQGFVGAMSLSDGEFVWQKPLSVYRNMALGHRSLYVTDAKDQVWAIDPINGQVYWKQDQLQVRQLTSPVITPYGVLVGDKMGWLHLLAEKEGTLIGRYGLEDQLLASPVVVDHRVIVLTQSGRLFSIALKK